MVVLKKRERPKKYYVLPETCGLFFSESRKFRYLLALRKLSIGHKVLIDNQNSLADRTSSGALQLQQT